VTASRRKLVHALTEAGLKTQAALAERIADLEGLEAAPKDIVNRAFRELSVDPLTIERIARALGVEAHTLYKTSDESGQTEPDSQQAGSTLRRIAWLAAAVAAVAVVVFSIQFGRSPEPAGEPQEAARDTVLDLGTATLVVLPINGDVDGALVNALRDRLAETFSVATATAAVLTQSLDRSEVAEKLRADVVIDGEIRQTGRFLGLRFYLLVSSVRQQVWAESVPAVSLADALDQIVGHVELAIRRATGYPVPDGDSPPHFPLAPVQDDYLEGALYLDQPANELNIKRAQTRFEAALRQDSNYARAHAGLCQALLEEYWMSDEERALKDAGRACGQALQLDPQDPVVAAAHAHFLSRTGRNTDALALYERIVGEQATDASAWSGLASALLQEYRQSGNRDFLVRAKDAARTAADVDPLIWKSLFALASMEWFDGNVAAAIAASEAALERDRNEYVLANLGTFYLCDGAFENALDAYRGAQEIAPQSYVGDEFMGMAHYFLGNFEESAKLRQRAIDSIASGEPEIHEMWGNLGDSYRQLGDIDSAIDAYLRAAEIAERDHLRGTRPAGDRAARAYYYSILESLDADLVPGEISRQIAAELDDIDAAIVSSSSHRRMAQTWLIRGDIGKARDSIARATATCRGFERLPDLADLNGRPRPAGRSE
jgi:tetratricopeptide (TPR) repeat protein